MAQIDELRFALDRTGVALIAGLVLIVGPTTILATAYVLTHGFDFASATIFELIVAVVASLLALVMIRAGGRELRGGLGVRVDEHGVHRGGLSIAWSEIEALAVPEFGVLDIVGAGKQLRLRTYLFCEPKRLTETVARRSGQPIPSL